jgi:cellulose synthase/poly-beta-1,6-N-acetylglucosamine synthase-like glycosyltransferase
MFELIRRYFRRHPIRSKRALEILPGLFSWSLILFPIWGSFLMPKVVAYYVIIFTVYWLYRSLVMAALSIAAHFKIKAASKFDWIADLKKRYPDQWNKIHHIIVIPTYKEPAYILERTLTSLSQQTYPTQNLHIMLSFEAREGEAAQRKAQELTKKFKHRFGHLWTTFHPDIEEEVKGKSSNTSWGAKIAKQKLIDEAGVDINLTTITSEDADARFHQAYFAYLSYEFLSESKPHNRVWQGAIVFYNNIWEVPAPIRVLASSYSVIQMYVLMRKDRLINFSTYSTSLKHAHEIGYWDTDVIPEDYRFFFKSYFAKHGEFEVNPIFLPVYADAPQAENLMATFKNQYQQLKRWAWGVSDDAYIIRQYFLSDAPFWDKTYRVLKVIEDHFLWPVNWFAVTISASLPPLLNRDFNRTMIGKTLPQVTSALLTISLISMVVMIIVDAANRPPKPGERSVFSYISQPLEFILMPVIGFFFSALPGIDAHTRLMLGKYIEYKVTKKV